MSPKRVSFKAIKIVRPSILSNLHTFLFFSSLRNATLLLVNFCHCASNCKIVIRIMLFSIFKNPDTSSGFYLFLLIKKFVLLFWHACRISYFFYYQSTLNSTTYYYPYFVCSLKVRKPLIWQCFDQLAKEGRFYQRYRIYYGDYYTKIKDSWRMRMKERNRGRET